MFTLQTIKSRSFLYPIAVIVSLALLTSACSSEGETVTAEVTIEGEALPAWTSDGEDAAVGQVAPEITGTDMNGEPAAIKADGRAKAIYFIAHWCRHCQDEVPVVADLIEKGEQPAELDIYAISTDVRGNQGNFPPSEWLEKEGFQPPTISDNGDNDALASYGSGPFPYVVYLDADHKVVARSAGQLSPDEIVDMWTKTAG